MPFAPKPILASRTFWINLASGAVALVTAVAGQSWVADNPALAAVSVAVLSVLNIGIRFLTDQPVKL